MGQFAKALEQIRKEQKPIVKEQPAIDVAKAIAKMEKDIQDLRFEVGQIRPSIWTIQEVMNEIKLQKEHREREGRILNLIEKELGDDGS